jgi:hypothetical protein
MEIQHAWLLYNVGDDVGLYPVILRLDARQDLSAAQRQQVENIWADWAVRRANAAMTAGHLLRGVEVLQAASLDYPDNLDIRRAVAGAYSKVGRAADSLTIFKTLPMDNASSGDFQGAIGAALAATDMAQAEAWLRQALAVYPQDPQILGLAARFEQARGNNERAADFWRAALAMMPPGSAVESLDRGLVYPPGSYQAPTPGELKHLLDPRNDPLANATRLPPLPGYASSTMNQSAPMVAAPRAAAPQRNQWIEAPSNNPLPLPPAGSYNPGTVPNAQGTVPSNLPVYIPQSVHPGSLVSQPVLIQQSWIQETAPQPGGDSGQSSQPVHHKAKARKSTPSYSGQMHLSPSEENIDSTDPLPSGAPVPSGAPAQNAQPAPLWTPPMDAQDTVPVRGLRITSQPMNGLAAQVQALFAEQTDSQLTQGSATALHAIPVVPLDPVLSNLNGQHPSNGEYSMTQYTPSAQEAATGAYSAPKGGATQQSATPEAAAPQQPAQQQQLAPCTANCPKPSAASHVRRSRRARRAAARASQQQTLSTWEGTPPAAQQQAAEPQPVEAQPQEQYPAETQSEQAPATSGAGLTDQELEQQNLPPLRGPWVRVQREPHAVSPREEAEMQLRAIESGYSGWLGGTGLLNYRTGDLGYDHLSALEAPFEASIPLGYNGRLTIVAKPVFLDSGQATGNSVISVQQSTTGGTVLATIPQPIGTLTTSDTTPPAQQNAVGVGGEVQLAFPHLAIAGGYTPAGFLVATFTGRFMWKPGNGPFTFNFSRDSVKDSQLSYAGLRDPAGNSLGTLGQVWGGVVANQGELQYSRGNAQSGFYFGAGGQYLTGYTVETNTRVDGLGGAYWRLLTEPEYGNLSIGANFFAMHYAHNEDAFTHGMGGYFSPQGYFLGNVPFTWVGHYGTQWHYTVVGALGVQAFSEDATPLWPLAADTSLETSQNNPMLPAKTSVGPNYDLRGTVAYQISPHWFAGGFFGANNTRNYQSATVGFYVRYLFRSQPSTATTPTGIFPTDGLRPFTVP